VIENLSKRHEKPQTGGGKIRVPEKTLKAMMMPDLCARKSGDFRESEKLPGKTTCE
jgi:hypothetical protein